MEGGRFDDLAKVIAGRAPRRSVVGSLVRTAAGGVLGIIGLPGLADDLTAAAKKKKKKKKKKSKGKSNKKKKKKRRQAPPGECTDAAGCAQPATPCRRATCINNSCGQENLPNGAVCGNGQVCFNGQCGPPCAAGCPQPDNPCQQATCINNSCGQESRPNGADCGNGQTCFGGQCGRPCDPSNPACDRGQQCCKDVCVDTNSSFAHCGKCEGPCRAERADRCVGGNCLCGPINAQCAVGFICTNGTCVCPANLTTCGSDCVDIATSFAHCGGCGLPCNPLVADSCADDACRCGTSAACAGGAECSAGACVCTGGTIDCSGECADIDTSFEHCGSCGEACPTGFADSCVNGRCRCGDSETCPSPWLCEGGACTCPQPLTICGDECADTETSLNHCGGCDESCGQDLADACVGGECFCGTEPRCTAPGQACDNGSCVCLTSPGTCRVRPTQLGGWEKAVSPGASVAFVAGPDIPPVGAGSLRLTIGSAATDFASLGYGAYQGLSIVDIAALSYSTFVENGGDPGDAAPAIRLPVQYDVGGDIRLTTLVFEPRNHQGMTVLTPGEWQLWNTVGPAGRWWSTQDIAASGISPGIAAGTPVTWGEVLDAIPDAMLDPGVAIALGPNAPNAVGHVDGLNVNETIYNFEEEPQS